MCESLSAQDALHTHTHTHHGEECPHQGREETLHQGRWSPWPALREGIPQVSGTCSPVLLWLFVPFFFPAESACSFLGNKRNGASCCGHGQEANILEGVLVSGGLLPEEGVLARGVVPRWARVLRWQADTWFACCCAVLTSRPVPRPSAVLPAARRQRRRRTRQLSCDARQHLDWRSLVS